MNKKGQLDNFQLALILMQSEKLW